MLDNSALHPLLAGAMHARTSTAGSTTRLASSRPPGPDRQSAEAERVLLLKAAFLADAAAAPAWEAWQQRIDLDDVDIQSQRILPRVQLNRPCNKVHDARVQGLYRRAWYANGILLQRVRPVVERLRARGLHPIVEKQSASVLAARGCFPLERFHLAVPDTQLAEAVDVLKHLAWRRAGPPARDVTAAAALRGMEFRSGKAAALVLRSHAALDDLFWANARTLEVDGYGFEIPGLAERVLDAAAPEFQWHTLTTTQRLHLVLLAFNHPREELSWPLLSRIASGRGLCLPLCDVLRTLQREFDVAVPEGFIEALQKHPVSLACAMEFHLSRHPRSPWRRAALPLLEYRRAAARGLVVGPVRYLMVRWNLENGWQVARRVGSRAFRRRSVSR